MKDLSVTYHCIFDHIISHDDIICIHVYDTIKCIKN